MEICIKRLTNHNSIANLKSQQTIDKSISFELISSVRYRKVKKLIWKLTLKFESNLFEFQLNKLIQVSIEQTCSKCILPRLFPQPLVDIDLNF